MQDEAEISIPRPDTERAGIGPVESIKNRRYRWDGLTEEAYGRMKQILGEEAGVLGLFMRIPLGFYREELAW